MFVGIANTEVPGQIAPSEAVGSGFTLFVEALIRLFLQKQSDLGLFCLFRPF